MFNTNCVISREIFIVITKKAGVGLTLAFAGFNVIRLGFEPKTHSLEGCCSIQLSYQTCLKNDLHSLFGLQS